MAIAPKVKLIWVALLLVILMLSVPEESKGQLITYLDSIEAVRNSDSIVINLYVDNFSGDSITGYTLWVSLAYADYIGFYSDSMIQIDTTYENCDEDSCIIWNAEHTVCLYSTCISYLDTLIDSSWVHRGAIDTTGSLTAGWDFVDAVVLDGSGRSVKINAIANQGGPTTPGIPSPTSQGLLCKMSAYVKEAADTCPPVDGNDTTWVPCIFSAEIDSVWYPWDEFFCDSVIRVSFDTTQTRFSNPEGQFIGWLWEDTAWNCVQVPPDFHQECVRRCVKDSSNQYDPFCNDSVCAYEYNSLCYLWECIDCDVWDSAGYGDPAQVLFSHGQITVTCPTCDWIVGDANYDSALNVSDAVWIINYVFVGGGAPMPVLQAGDANCDLSVNVSDAVWIINYVFTGGPPPPCTCEDLI